MSLFAVCLAAGADQTDAMLAQPAMAHTLNAVIDEKWVTEMGPGGDGLSSWGSAQGRRLLGSGSVSVIGVWRGPNLAQS